MQVLRSLFLLLWAWPLGAGAQDFWVGHFEDDGEEFQDVPHGLDGPPKALFIWTDGLTDPVNHRGGALSWSICDAERCLGWAGDRIRVPRDGGGSWERSRRVTHQDPIHFIDGTTADLIGWTSTHLSFRWHGDPSSGRIHVLAIGGEGTRAKVVNWNLPATRPTGRVEVTGVGFEPDVLLSLTSDQALSSIPLTQDGMSLKMSVATRHDLAQWTTGTATNVSGDSLVARWLLQGSFIAGGGTSAFPVHQGQLVGMTSDGFMVDFPVSSGVTGAVATLALSGVQAQVGSINGPAVSGQLLQEFTDMRFPPQAMLFRSVQAPTGEGPRHGASLGLGMSDGISSSATAFREAPLGSVSVARGLGVVHLGLYDGVEGGGRTELRSLDARGFTLAWEDHAGVPVELAWLALSTAEEDDPTTVPRLRFTRQPEDGVVDAPLGAVEVLVTSEADAPLSGVAVRLELVGGTGVSLLGTLEATTVEGVARFSDLTIDGAATDLRLRARVSESAAVESEPFSVRAAAPELPGHYRIACGCGAGDAGPPWGWAILLLVLWTKPRLRSLSRR